MNLGVVADTHLPRFGKQLPEPLQHGLREHRVSHILHLGDFTSPDVVDWLEAIAPVDAVAGNNDPQALVDRFGRRKVLTFDGVRIGLVHGDGMRKTTLERALAAFATEPVDVILFGHSHQPYCERHGSVWAFNPGSPADKRRQPQYSYGILTITDGQVRPSLHFYPSK